MNNHLVVDTTGLRELSSAGRRARREVEHEAEALGHGAREGARACQDPTLEAHYEHCWENARTALHALGDRLGSFAAVLDEIAGYYEWIDASGQSTLVAGALAASP